jgi:hypothetical protein
MLPRSRSDNVAVALESKLDIEFSPHHLPQQKPNAHLSSIIEAPGLLDV